MTCLIKCIYQLFPGAVFSLIHNDFISLREGVKKESISINDFLFHRTNLSNENQLISFLCSHPGSRGLAIYLLLSQYEGREGEEVLQNLRTQARFFCAGSCL